jgi:ketosteroid isomerase-like protein
MMIKRFLLTFTAAASAWANAAAAAPPDRQEQDKAAIIAGERRMCGMENMSQRIEDTIGFYDKDVVQFDIMPEVFVGQDAVRKSLAKQYGPIRNLRCQIQDLHVGVDGDLGYAFSLQAFEADAVRDGPYGNADLHGEGQKPGQPFTFKMAWRQTDIWKKKDGKWTMIHQHSSFPIDPSTGKAAMESRAIETSPTEGK